jgi:NTE family protein
LILASATDISTGARLVFDQDIFDVMCSDLSAVKLSRAAAASSAVPLVLSPMTFNNYGGTCNYQPPPAWNRFANIDNAPRTVARAKREIEERLSFADSSKRPYLHLFDGGISDNVGMRSVLTLIELMDALKQAGVPTRLDKVKRIAVFVVNSISSPKTDWDQQEKPPGLMNLLLKASGVPIDHFSYEAMELLKDKQARWQSSRHLRNTPALANSSDPKIKENTQSPDVDIYTIDISFSALKDKAEYAYLNELPTSFVLPDESVDRLRAAAGVIINESPEFHRLLKDIGAKPVSKAQPTTAKKSRPASKETNEPSPFTFETKGD